MARKKKHAEHVNHERWLVSYADFMTLLFAFFVVMFAVSQVDTKKVGRFTESFSKAVGIDMFPEPGSGLMPGGDVPMPAAGGPTPPLPLPPELRDLEVALAKPQARAEAPQGLSVVVRRNELVIRLSENLLFAPGDDALREAPTATIKALARELAPRNVDVRIEGHTDDRPIHNARFPSNWQLSTARATAVVNVLAAAGIAPMRLSAAGYGEFHPVAPNTSDEGRKQNRRVDIVVSVSAPPEAP
ncbi:MAG: OmpA family protein [Labilithrix sp.]|nr:OmpA family protein [Labilithrix sp.]